MSEVLARSEASTPDAGPSKSVSPPRPDRDRTKSSSPEPNCAICLGKLENKSFTDSCFHTFCFVCLQEWSKVQAVCPLCKQPFKSIIHNVRSFEDYDQYHLRDEAQAAAELSRRRRYSLRTLTNEQWWERQHREQERQMELLQRPSRLSVAAQWRRHPQIVTSAYRRQVYANGTRMAEVRMGSLRPPRYREVSAQFYRQNPAVTHRLVPWLNRELIVLLANHENRVQFVLELILDLIQRFEIRGEEFFQHIQPFFGSRTEHFIHEFYSFARSAYDMTAYDQRAVYEDPPEQPVHTIDSSDDDPEVAPTYLTSSEPTEVIAVPDDDDDDDDLIVVSAMQPADETMTSQDHPYSSFSGHRLHEGLPATLRLLPHFDLTPLLNRVHNFLSSVDPSSASIPHWDSPVPGPSAPRSIHADTISEASSCSCDLLSTSSRSSDILLTTRRHSVSSESSQDSDVVIQSPASSRNSSVVYCLSDSDVESVSPASCESASEHSSRLIDVEKVSRPSSESASEHSSRLIDVEEVSSSSSQSASEHSSRLIDVEEVTPASSPNQRSDSYESCQSFSEREYFNDMQFLGSNTYCQGPTDQIASDQGSSNQNRSDQQASDQNKSDQGSSNQSRSDQGSSNQSSSGQTNGQTNGPASSNSSVSGQISAQGSSGQGGSQNGEDPPEELAEIKQEQESNYNYGDSDSDSSAVILVGFTKPFEERSPMPLSEEDPMETQAALAAAAAEERERQEKIIRLIRQRQLEGSRSRSGSRSCSRSRYRSRSRSRSSRYRRGSTSRSLYRSSRSRYDRSSRSGSQNRSRDRQLDSRRDPRRRTRSRSRDHETYNFTALGRYDYSNVMVSEETRSKDRNDARTRDRDEPRSRDRNERRTRDRDEPRNKDRDERRIRDHDEPRSRARDERRIRDHGEPRSRDRDERRIRDHDEPRSRDHDERRARDHNEPRSKDRDELRIRAHDEPRSRDRDERKTRNHDERQLGSRDREERQMRRSRSASSSRQQRDKSKCSDHGDPSVPKAYQILNIDHSRSRSRSVEVVFKRRHKAKSKHKKKSSRQRSSSSESSQRGRTRNSSSTNSVRSMHDEPCKKNKFGHKNSLTTKSSEDRASSKKNEHRMSKVEDGATHRPSKSHSMGQPEDKPHDPQNSRRSPYQESLRDRADKSKHSTKAKETSRSGSTQSAHPEHDKPSRKFDKPRESSTKEVLGVEKSDHESRKRPRTTSGEENRSHKRGYSLRVEQMSDSEEERHSGRDSKQHRSGTGDSKQHRSETSSSKQQGNQASHRGSNSLDSRLTRAEIDEVEKLAYQMTYGRSTHSQR